MTHEISLKQVGDHWYDVSQNGNIIRIDSSGETGTTGVRPKALILSALAGCTAIDVHDILQKMRVEYTDFRIDVSGELTEEHPKTYHTVNLTYFIKLQHEEDKAKMEKAVNLSQEKYCGVSAMIRKFAALNFSITYL